jgi:hypothetical protein
MTTPAGAVTIRQTSPRNCWRVRGVSVRDRCAQWELLSPSPCSCGAHCGRFAASAVDTCASLPFGNSWPRSYDADAGRSGECDRFTHVNTNSGWLPDLDRSLRTERRRRARRVNQRPGAQSGEGSRSGTLRGFDSRRLHSRGRDSRAGLGRAWRTESGVAEARKASSSRHRSFSASSAYEQVKPRAAAASLG